MISSLFPHPPQGEAQTRTFHLMEYLGQRHEVTLVTRRSQDLPEAAVEKVRTRLAKLVVFPDTATQRATESIVSKAKRLGQRLGQGTPNRVFTHYSLEMQQWLDRAVGEENPDAIVCEHSFDEIYVRPEWQQNHHTVVNVHHSLYGMCKQYLQSLAAERKKLADQLNLPLLGRYEHRYGWKFSAIATTSLEDKQQLRELNVEVPISIVPNGVKLAAFPKRSQDPGGYHLVYLEAPGRSLDDSTVEFFCERLFPEVQRRYPEATLELVAGVTMPELPEKCRQPSIYMSDRPHRLQSLQRATVCVLPLSRGPGMKLQTLEAMAVGAPVVGSDRALEGIPADGGDVPLAAMRATAIDEYVYSIGRLFQDANLRSRLSTNARALVEKEYTWERIGEKYERTIVPVRSIRRPSNAIADANALA